jgi:hypothetical protein
MYDVEELISIFHHRFPDIVSNTISAFCVRGCFNLYNLLVHVLNNLTLNSAFRFSKFSRLFDVYVLHWWSLIKQLSRNALF